MTGSWWLWTPFEDVDDLERARGLAASPMAKSTYGDTDLPAWAGRIAELEHTERNLRDRLAAAEDTTYLAEIRKAERAARLWTFALAFWAGALLFAGWVLGR